MNWHAIGTGWNGSVSALAVRGRDVFIGGRQIDESGAVKVSGVFHWNGHRWSNLGGGVSDPAGLERIVVGALFPIKNDLFIGGRFTFADNKVSANVGRWIPEY